MPSVRYYNQSAPFWDFVANLEEQGSSHPWFANREGEATDNENSNPPPNPPNPWTDGWAGFPFGGPFPHRGRHGGSRHGHGPHPTPAAAGTENQPEATESEKDSEAGPSEPRGPPPPFSEQPEAGPGRHGPGSRRGGCGMRGRGGWGGRGRGGHFGPPGGFPGGFGALANMFQSQIFGDEESKEKDGDDFKPDVDVFDAAEAFIVHVSLPGAKKEDVGVNWDAEKSELSIAGVIYRPADEETLKTLALNERKVGAFERKVRLGSRANPAQVEVDEITAKMEDGILRVEVPKQDSGYVEIKKVDIE